MKVSNLKMQEELGKQNQMTAVLEQQWKKGLLKEEGQGNYVAVDDPEEQIKRREEIASESKAKASKEHQEGVEFLKEAGRKAMEKYGGQQVQDEAEEDR